MTPTYALANAPAKQLAVARPVTLKPIITDGFTWMGIGHLATNLPNPALPMASPLETVWLAARQFQYTWNNRRPVTHVTLSGQDPKTGQISGSLNATDYDDANLTYKITTAPTHGAVVVDNAGNFVYTPSSTIATTGGVDTFGITVDDSVGNPPHVHGLLGILGLERATTATVTVTVKPITSPDNHSPETATPAYDFAVDQATGVVTGTVHITDPDGDQLRYTLTSVVDAEIGVATVDATTGNWTFTPTDTARLNAWTSPGADTAHIVVGITDGINPDVTIDVSAPIIAAAHFEAANISGAEQESWGNQGLAVAPDGRYYYTTYLVDNKAGQVVILDPDGQYSHTVDIAKVVPYTFVSAYDVAIGNDGNVYVSGEAADSLDALEQETGRGVIVIIDPANADAASLFADTADPLSALAVGADGRVYAANWNNDTIRVFNPDGSLYQTVDTQSLVEDDDSGVAGLAVDPDGWLYLTKPQLGVLKVIDPADGTTSIVNVGGQPWSVEVGANGVAYVTSFNDPAVALLDPAGTVFRTFDLGPGASPSDVTLAADGRIHVAYLTANGGSIAVISAVAATSDTAAVIGPVFSGVPAGPPVVVGDVVYQAVSGIDPANGKPVVTVAVTNALGSTTLVQVPGEQVGAPVLGPDDVIFQTVCQYDASTGTYQTGLLRVAADGTRLFTGLFAGSPSGGVVFDQGDNAYQIVVGADSTRVLALSAAGSAAAYSIAGTPDFFVAAKAGQPTVTINGIVYLTTIEIADGIDGPTTHLTALGQTDGATFSVAGVASGPPAVTSTGTIVQAITRSALDDQSGIATFTTVAVALTDSGLIELADTVPGLPVGSPVAGSDGTLYQTVVNFDVGTDGSTSDAYTSVMTIGDTGLVPIFERLPGTPVDGDGALTPLVAGTDGIVYQTTYGYTDPSIGDLVTLVAALNPTGIVYGGVIPGQPGGPPSVGVGGVVYQTTFDGSTGRTRVGVVTATSTDIYEFNGLAGSAVVAPDGTFYQIVVSQDPFDGTDITTVVVGSGTDVLSSSYSGTPTGTVIFDSSGAAYLTVGGTDFANQTAYTQVLSINGDSITPFGAAIRGNPGGTAVVGADGTVYQSVFDADGVGSFTAAVHVVEPLMSMARSNVVASTMSASASYTRVVDDAYLAPFLAADPDMRFSYTRLIVEAKGQTADFTPMSDADLAKHVQDYVDLTGVSSAGFSRDSQGRIAYYNSTNEDVLVVYGSSPVTYAQGALLAHPGKTVVLPAGPEGRVAAAEALNADTSDFIAAAYRGSSPIPTTAPKSNVVLTSSSSAGHTVKTEDLVKRIAGMPADSATVDIVKSGNAQRMVVYVSGVNGDLNFSAVASWNQAFQVRYFGLIPGFVSSAINGAMKVYPNVSEIMLVGHSKGGMIVQNYAKSGYYKSKVTVVVASAAPIISVPDDRIKVIYLRDPYDSLVGNITDGNALRSNDGKGRIYNTPPTSDSGAHSFDNYEEIARNFDWDPKWTAVKQAINNFHGTTIATNPKPPKPGSTDEMVA